MSAKQKLCKVEGCNEPVVNFPNSTIKKQYCKEHAIKAVLNKVKQQAKQDKEGLEKARNESKKRTPRERFYSSSAWRNFSHYILLIYADENLEVQCSTDPSLTYKITDRNIAVGHCIKVFDGNSTNYSVAFEPFNVCPQSVQQNIYFGGNPEVMKVFLEEQHGIGTIEFLENKKRESFRLDKYTLDEISKKYIKLFNDELRLRKINNPWK